MTEEIKTDTHFIIKEEGIVFEKTRLGLTVNLFSYDDFISPNNKSNTAFTCHTVSDPKFATLRRFVKLWLKENPNDE